MDRMKARVSTVATMVVAVTLGAMTGAWAQESTPVETIISEAQDVVTTNVPLIAAGLAVLLGVALGIRAMWTAYANAKKGVSQMK